MPQSDEMPPAAVAPVTPQWVPLSYFEDEILARMSVTYLQAADVPARVTQQIDCFAVEVPRQQLGRAGEVCDPTDGSARPQLLEIGVVAGVSLARLNAYASTRGPSGGARDTHHRRFKVALLVVLACVALFLLIFLI